MPPSLPVLYAGALDKAARAFNLPAINDETQELIQGAFSDLIELTTRVASLSLFSSNELLDDISTSDLVYLTLPFIRAEVQNRIKTTNGDDRMSNVTQVLRHLKMFVSDLETYSIIPEAERVLYGQQMSSIKEAAKRREVKIRQYKTEKDLRARVEVIRRRRRHLVSAAQPLSNLDLVAPLLFRSEDDAEDIAAEDVLREATLLLLRLFYAQASVQLEGLDQEVKLLRNAPPMSLSPADEGLGETNEQESMWKVDAHSAFPNSGPLLDSRGKPLRPFTILPAGASDRTRLHAQVFGPGHRLPTMTVDEYLDIEGQRGGILSTRGTAEAKATSSKQLTLDSEMDGTALGDVRAEERRYKDEQWAEYTDNHPRGAGNTINRG